MKLYKFNNPADIKYKIILVGVLILFAVFSRLLPHPPNFTPVAAVAIFGGAVLPKRWALSLPLITMMASDLMIGLHPLVLYTWGSFAVIALLSNVFIKKIKPASVAVASLSASIFFYLVTNFGVWAQGQLYPSTAAGLISSYYNALPFFRNTLLGDMTYSAILFGVYALAYKFVIRRLITHTVKTI